MRRIRGYYFPGTEDSVKLSAFPSVKATVNTAKDMSESPPLHSPTEALITNRDCPRLISAREEISNSPFNGTTDSHKWRILCRSFTVQFLHSTTTIAANMRFAAILVFVLASQVFRGEASPKDKKLVIFPTKNFNSC